MHLAYSPQHWLRHRSYCTSVLITGQWRLWTICQLILHLVLYRWWSRCHRPIRISQWAGLPNKWSWHGNQAVGHSWLEYGTSIYLPVGLIPHLLHLTIQFLFLSSYFLPDILKCSLFWSASLFSQQSSVLSGMRWMQSLQLRRVK